jgi:hypothetical protein
LRLRQKTAECINFLSLLVDNDLQARESLEWLDDHPEARNLVMADNSQKSPAYSTLDVLNAHVGPHAQNGLLPARQTNNSLLFSPLVPKGTKYSPSNNLAYQRVAKSDVY